jgi:hypothetical protein
MAEGPVRSRHVSEVPLADKRIVAPLMGGGSNNSISGCAGVCYF